MAVTQEARQVAAFSLPRMVSATRTVEWRDEVPTDLYPMLAGGDLSVLLESAQEDRDWGRYTVVGCNPLLGIELWPDRCILWRRSGERSLFPAISTEDCLPFLRSILARCPSGDGEAPLLGGGLVGYIGFGCAPLLRSIPVTPRASTVPLMSLFLPGEIVVFDAVRRRLDLSVLCEEESAGAGGVEGLLDGLVRKVRHPGAPRRMPMVAGDPGAAVSHLRPLLPRAEMEHMVASARDLVLAGEAIQVVVAQPFAGRMRLDPLDVYLALRELNPSPYMFHLRLGPYTLVGSSPETMVRVRGGRAVVRPIAGTRPRGATPVEDEALAGELAADPKERAEHLMLLDLARNDLGMVAKPGGVEVDASFQLEHFSHVMHLVSSVSAEMAQGVDALDVLAATFPAGTVSGAPKVRAMQLIAELETMGRGAYGGAVGYLSGNGDLDTCICIRTLLCKDTEIPGEMDITAFGGAGVVADSDPAHEYEETLHKVAALSAALKRASYRSSRPRGDKPTGGTPCS